VPLLGASRVTRSLGRRGAVTRALALFAGRVSWWRVAAGATLAVLGSLSATLLLELAARAASAHATGYTPATLEGQFMQDKILTWEVKALLILAGAALAGTNTRNGFKQGLFVGVLVTLALSAVLAWQGRGTLPILAGTVISAVCLSVVGGWFGSQLLPPLVGRRPRGFGPASAF
jgi:hypothetical protein